MRASLLVTNKTCTQGFNFFFYSAHSPPDFSLLLSALLLRSGCLEVPLLLLWPAWSSFRFPFATFFPCLLVVALLCYSLLTVKPFIGALVGSALPLVALLSPVADGRHPVWKVPCPVVARLRWAYCGASLDRPWWTPCCCPLTVPWPLDERPALLWLRGDELVVVSCLERLVAGAHESIC